MGKLLTYSELASALSVHKNTIRRWVELAGCPVAVQKDRIVRFDLDAVKRWLEVMKLAHNSPDKADTASEK